jgi:hypothetical protein
MLNVAMLSDIMLKVVVPSVLMLNRGAQKLTGDNLKVVWAEFSTIN